MSERVKIEELRPGDTVQRIGRVANEYERIAERRAAELIDLIGVPLTYEDAVNALAIAYLDGGRDQLKWARDRIFGEGE